MRIYCAHRGFLAAAGLLTLVAAGCAVSDQLDLSDAAVTGTGGTGANDNGTGGTDQGTGGSATGGSTGSGGVIATGGSGTGGRGTGLATG